MIALVFALAGGALAATAVKKNTVTSKSIKDGAVQGPDVKDDALTGADLDESTLGKVPSAQSADSAQSAQSAQTAQTAQSAQTAESAQTAQSAETVSSQVKIDQRGNQSPNFSSIAQLGGMDLQSRCSAPNAGETELELRLVSTPAAVANSSYLLGFGSAGPDPAERSEPPAPAVVRGAAIGAGGSFAVVPSKVVNAVDALNDASAAPNTFIQAEGQIVYRNDSSVVTVTFHSFLDHTGANAGYCEVLGTAVAT